MAKQPKILDKIAGAGGDDAKGFETFIFIPKGLQKPLDKAFAALRDAKVRNVCARNYRGADSAGGGAKVIKTVVSKRRLLYELFADKAFAAAAKTFAANYTTARIAEATETGEKTKELEAPNAEEKYLVFMPYKIDGYLVEAAQKLKTAGVKNKYNALRVAVGKRCVLYAFLSDSATVNLAKDFFKTLTARRIAEQPKTENNSGAEDSE